MRSTLILPIWIIRSQGSKSQGTITTGRNSAKRRPRNGIRVIFRTSLEEWLQPPQAMLVVVVPLFIRPSTQSKAKNLKATNLRSSFRAATPMCLTMPHQ